MPPAHVGIIPAASPFPNGTGNAPRARGDDLDSGKTAQFGMSVPCAGTCLWLFSAVAPPLISLMTERCGSRVRDVLGQRWSSWLSNPRWFHLMSLLIMGCAVCVRPRRVPIESRSACVRRLLLAGRTAAICGGVAVDVNKRWSGCKRAAQPGKIRLCRGTRSLVGQLRKRGQRRYYRLKGRLQPALCMTPFAIRYCLYSLHIE